MITLYHAPHSRSAAIIWLLEELGAHYKIEVVSIIYDDGHGAPAPESYRAIHPHKKVPAIEHDGTIVFECIAICSYLADTFPQAKLSPGLGTPARGRYDTLLAYWAGPFSAIANARLQQWDRNGADTRLGTFDDMTAFIIKTIEAANPWILGEQFTSADILYGSSVEIFTELGLLPKKDVFDAYIRRLNLRPARRRARERDRD